MYNMKKLKNTILCLFYILCVCTLTYTYSLRDTKVLDMFPMDVKVAEQIYWFQLPQMGPLGKVGRTIQQRKFLHTKKTGPSSKQNQW